MTHHDLTLDFQAVAVPTRCLQEPRAHLNLPLKKHPPRVRLKMWSKLRTLTVSSWSISKCADMRQLKKPFQS